MNRQINLPSLTLPTEYKGALNFQSSKTNYKQYEATEALKDLLAEHIPADFFAGCEVFVQEFDSSLNDRIYTLGFAPLRLRYIISAANGVVHTHDSEDNITSTIALSDNSWVLTDATSKISSASIVGVQTSILVRYTQPSFAVLDQAWINSVTA